MTELEVALQNLYDALGRAAAVARAEADRYLRPLETTPAPDTQTSQEGS
jgi:hypothetical protein